MWTVRGWSHDASSGRIDGDTSVTNLESFQIWCLAEAVQMVDPEELLRGADLRVTRPRVAVINALATQPHADAEAVRRLAHADLGAVSVQAIYDVLKALHDADLVRRIEPAGASALYELRVGDNHHHIVCRSCGAVADVDCAVGEAPCLTAAESHGFEIDEAEVTYWGLCPDCLTNHSGRKARD